MSKTWTGAHKIAPTRNGSGPGPSLRLAAVGIDGDPDPKRGGGCPTLFQGFFETTRRLSVRRDHLAG